MNEKKRSQKGFVAVTLITLLAIAMVIVVYASLLATIPGGEVLVGENVAGDVYYSLTNSTGASWDPTLNVSSTGTSWYARINFTSTYIGQVTITWKLQQKNMTWSNTTGTESTTVQLYGGGNQAVYASSNGEITGNHDWKDDISQNGQYRVKAWVETTS